MERTVSILEALDIAARQFQRGAYERAEDVCRRVLASDPDCSEAEFWLGKVLDAQGRHEEALTSHERSLWLRPVVRWHVIQAAIAWSRATTYLEIGLGEAGNFCRITAARKLGVDPVPLEGPALEEVHSGRAEFLQTTSDEFFAQYGAILAEKGLDVAFVDGLHTYEQSLADVERCLKSMNDGGVVLMHDCNPTSEAMAAPASSYEEVTGENPGGPPPDWTGDVWKTIVHLRACSEGLRVAVLDCDYGVGVIVKRPGSPCLSISPDVIRSWTYRDLESNRRELLNLQPPQYLFKMLRQQEP
jgi:tetratricopeptide (TPR) repeat protein